jgi:hypothetical protein
MSLTEEEEKKVDDMILFKLPSHEKFPKHMIEYIDICYNIEIVYISTILEYLKNIPVDIIFIILKYYYLSIKITRGDILFISKMDIGESNDIGNIKYSKGTSVIITANIKVYNVKFFKNVIVSHNTDGTITLFGIHNIERQKYIKIIFENVYINLENIVCIRKMEDNSYRIVVLTSNIDDIHIEKIPTVIISDYTFRFFIKNEISKDIEYII